MRKMTASTFGLDSWQPYYVSFSNCFTGATQTQLVWMSVESSTSHAITNNKSNPADTKMFELLLKFNKHARHTQWLCWLPCNKCVDYGFCHSASCLESKNSNDSDSQYEKYGFLSASIFDDALKTQSIWWNRFTEVHTGALKNSKGPISIFFTLFCFALNFNVYFIHFFYCWQFIFNFFYFKDINPFCSSFYFFLFLKMFSLSAVKNTTNLILLTFKLIITIWIDQEQFLV